MTVIFMKKQCDGLCSMDNKCKGTVKEVIVTGFDDDSGKVPEVELLCRGEEV